MAESESDQQAMVEQLFRQWGASESQAQTMASQLLKRARQIAEEDGVTVVQGTEKLLRKVVEAREEA